MIGLPSDINWPKNVSVLRSSFEPYPQACLKTEIPEICSDGKDLLMVRFIYTFLRMSVQLFLRGFMEEISRNYIN